MQELLEKEGVIVVEDQIQNFKDLVWDPMEELSFD
jgi:methylated-DNA-protein-cysteine methyltransferase-like protein